MIQAIELKKKDYIEYDSMLFMVLDYSHVKPGKGGAFIKAKLKCLTKPMIITKTFRSNEKIKEIKLEHKTVGVLYNTDKEFYFIDTKNYNQYSLTIEQIGKESIPFLKPNLELTISFYDDKVVDITLPISVDLKVIYTEPAVKGNTSVNAVKDAKLETGYIVKVPLFININDIIRIDTKTREYTTRIS